MTDAVARPESAALAEASLVKAARRVITEWDQGQRGAGVDLAEINEAFAALQNSLARYDQATGKWAEDVVRSITEPALTSDTRETA